MKKSAVLSAIVGVFVLTAAGILAYSMIPSRVQERGQVGLWTGPTKKLVKVTTTEGINSFNPLNSVEYYDVKNNIIRFAGGGDQTIINSKGEIESPQISTTNSESTSVDIELSVIYSINPKSVQKIWQTNPSQEAFATNIVAQEIRSSVRSVFPNYTLIETFSKRDEIALEIEKTISETLEPQGVIIDNLNLQNIKYKDEVTNSFTAYQQKNIEVETEKAETEKQLIAAQRKIDVAKKEAEANKIKSDALDEKILTEQYIDAISKKDDLLIITDGNSTPMINVK